VSEWSKMLQALANWLNQIICMTNKTATIIENIVLFDVLAYA